MAVTHVSVKRPVGEDERTFKAASGVFPGMLVKITSTGVAAATASGTDEYIGVALYDDAQIANSGTDEYVAGKIVPVRLKSTPMRAVVSTGRDGADLAAGEFLIESDTAGRIQPEASKNVKTIDTIGIALESGGTDDDILFVRL